jgi:DNA end-binding protein Ku
MAEQAIWNGTISFSLVAIPVRLVKAVEPGRVSFRLLHNKDYSPLIRKMYCPQENKFVSSDEIVRGYEIGPNQYIPITDEELESVSPERSRTIEIIEFIDMKEMDSIYFNHPYYLVPAKGGEKAYKLLSEVMHRTNKAGLAKFILGEREYLVAVYSTGGALSLMTLHYSEEILSQDDLAPDAESVSSTEHNQMKKIVKDMIADFNPGKQVNERRKRIMALIKKKAKKQSPVEAPHVDEEGGEAPVDLVAMLEESMRKVKKNR